MPFFGLFLKKLSKSQIRFSRRASADLRTTTILGDAGKGGGHGTWGRTGMTVCPLQACEPLGRKRRILAHLLQRACIELPNSSSDQIGKEVPQNVQKLCLQRFWPFVDIFRTFVMVLLFWAVQRFALCNTCRSFSAALEADSMPFVQSSVEAKRGRGSRGRPQEIVRKCFDKTA